MPDSFHLLEETVTADVSRALAEDVGTGDLTAHLIPEGTKARARLGALRDEVGGEVPGADVLGERAAHVRGDGLFEEVEGVGHGGGNRRPGSTGALIAGSGARISWGREESARSPGA